MDCVNLERRKGCLPSGGPIQGVWLSVWEQSREVPSWGRALAATQGSLCCFCPKEGCPGSTAEPGAVGEGGLAPVRL